MTTKHRPLSYEILQIRETGGPRTIARIWCAACGGTLDLTLTANRHADNVERRAKAKGWDCDKNRASRTICPDCKAAPPAKIKPAMPVVPKACRSATAAKPSTHAISTANMEPPMTAITPAVRPATPDERMRIRHKLDGVFDDAKGMYLDSFSDQRVAEELKLPRKMIEQIREAAYGPIRTDSEIEQLRTDIADLVAMASTLTNRLAEVEKRFKPR
jgi:hypothetical protein